MFGRTIQLDVVKKTGQSESSGANGPSTEDYAAMATKIIETGTQNIMKAVATYMVLDTTRKIIVGRLSK